MFVGFGLSAIFPVLHGVYMYGLEQMRYSIGLDWVLLQGFLYILGAAIYAVCFSLASNLGVRTAQLIQDVRHVYLRGSNLGDMISGVAPIRYSMSSYSWLQFHNS